MGQKALVYVLGDQLSLELSSLRLANLRTDVVLMAEVDEEARYAAHHKKKLALIFAAMRHFAEALQNAGWQVDYIRLDDPGNSGSLRAELERALQRHDCDKVLITAPSEYRLRVQFEQLSLCSATLKLLEDDRFICDIVEFERWASGRKQLRMEYFYREMRKKTGLLMDGAQPEGGRWNFDADNRKPARGDMEFPKPMRFAPDPTTVQVLELVASRFESNFGELSPFWFAVNRADAELAFEHFIDTALPRFGDFQDAMLRGESFLFHAVISMYLNLGLLDPVAVCRRVEAEYRAGEIPLNAAEGFIRQIIGWREYVRGIYWLKMPEYRESNFFEHTEALPDFYWSAETELACVRECVSQTSRHAYAHHIQRLMITGNFALLIGVEPKQVHDWYLGVYLDAFEWVELPNTIGMSQFADGGLLGSKPYISSGNYINKMSDYCRDCRYDVKQKNGPDACPFNYLYWDFLDRHREKLADNARLKHPYRTWDRMSPAKQTTTRNDATHFRTLVGVGPR